MSTADNAAAPLRRLWSRLGQSAATRTIASRVVTGLGWVVLTVYFFLPAHSVLNGWLDPSNYASYAYFTAHGFHYGPDVVPMAGPFGFVLYGFVYGGELFGARIVGQLIFNGALAALTLWFFLQLRGSALRWVWLVMHLAFTPFVEDLPMNWALLLGGLLLLQPIPVVVAAATAALFGWLSLFKGTHLVLAPVTLAVVLASHALKRDWPRAGVIAGTYMLSLILCWLAAGQPLGGLPVFIDGVRQLASGYTAAMSLPAPWDILIRGIITFVLLAAGLVWSAWHHRRNLVALAGLALFSGFLFVQWKHGFVRADGHIHIFFHYAAAAVVAGHLFGRHLHHLPIAGGRVVRALGPILLAAGLLAALVGAHGRLESPGEASRRMQDRLRGNFHHLTDFADEKQRLDVALDAQRQLWELPAISAIVGDRPIDFFGHDHGVIPLNGFNYRPRPMGGGSFNVYSGGLLDRNGDYVRNPATRPDFFLLKTQTIDGRLVAADDGPTLLEILHGYSPRLVEKGLVLMEARPSGPAPEPRSLGSQVYRFGDYLSVPAVGPGELLLARLEFPPSLLGRLLSFVHQPPRVAIQLIGPDLPPERHRIVPAVVSRPFLLAPALEDTGDFLNLYTARAGGVPEQIRITTTDRAGYARDLTIEFFALPRPAALSTDDIDDLSLQARATIEFLYADQATPGVDVSVYPFQSLLMHPPDGHLRWKLEGGETTVDLGFGLVRGAYENNSFTDGVGFVVELHPPGAPALEIFKRFLDPLNQVADRGHQTARLTLPSVVPGTRLVVRTHAGPRGDTNWDWAYITNPIIK